ncbi:MAG TPA: mannose-1-phosphate guanylyltransferase/mannose-6-phosphate isomerase [Deltaproteobacteria bacterium]|nr:mannose-1-phosphate guanylyltransferase/mannose-6-phosphate isomerase [Deltaproteobacteria bacterium]HCY11246.1 mannose-1-phosphate guanylyltransferase/mannose-6-phosphate isomerase [Deltaproteobacteria bacterium]
MSRNQGVSGKKAASRIAASAVLPKPLKRRASPGAALKRRGGGKLYATILAGGIGTRFWPLSRETTPKQVLKVVGDESLLKSTIKRLSPLVPPDRVMIVTNARQAEIIRLHLASDRASEAPGYIIEPMGRNTAAAIALAAFELYRKEPDAVMAVLPADHVIEDGRPFRAAMKAALKVAREGRLVTFGIVPTRPETGYGYIKAMPRAFKNIDGFGVRNVERFVEKPDIRKARRYLKEGGYYWNSGIFIWKAERILDEIKEHLPDLYASLSECADVEGITEAYKNLKDISIDHGILEKARGVVVIPASFAWSDMGTWSSFNTILKPDLDGNIIRGRVVDIGSSNSLILGCDRAVATIGLKDIILVDTPDATLVCPRERAQEVKDVVSILKKKKYTEHEVHRTVDRPWGSYTLLESGEGYKIKKIRVEPRRRLSLQMHHHRSEHWVVISGTARVQRGEEVVDISINQSTYIPRGVRHRLENPGDTPLEIIEVQNGEYVEEEDIVRFEDDFQRK